jgi:hypothetical protein
MAKSRNKVVFEGMAKIRIETDENGKMWLCTEVGGPGADDLKQALGSLVGTLCGADDTTLAKMAEEMCRT